jgi:hypothetical protein
MRGTGTVKGRTHDLMKALATRDLLQSIADHKKKNRERRELTRVDAKTTGSDVGH